MFLRTEETTVFHTTTVVSSHPRMVLTRTSETIPIDAGRMQLGTWQGIFVFEHRRAPHTRSLAVTVIGQA